VPVAPTPTSEKRETMLYAGTAAHFNADNSAHSLQLFSGGPEHKREYLHTNTKSAFCHFIEFYVTELYLTLGKVSGCYKKSHFINVFLLNSF
jgi:hypothetical protein